MLSVAGLDLAWAHTGYSVLREGRLVSWGVITTSPRHSAAQRAPARWRTAYRAC